MVIGSSKRRKKEGRQKMKLRLYSGCGFILALVCVTSLCMSGSDVAPNLTPLQYLHRTAFQVQF